MFWTGLAVALIFALLMAAVFGLGFGRVGPWGGVFWFFLVVFLGAWAIGTWTVPVGPVVWGVPWAPFLVGALAVALLLAAIAEPAPRQPRGGSPGELESELEAQRTLGAFFWVFLLILILVVAFGSF